MTSKPVLLVIDDKLLQRLYQEKIEEAGFVVITARELGKAARLIAEKSPQLVLMDVVFQEGDPREFLKALRDDPANALLPVFILPSQLAQTTDKVLKSGATRTISPGTDPIPSILDVVRTTFGKPAQGKTTTSSAKSENFWPEAVFANAMDSINRMRHCLPGVTAVPPELPALHELWNLAHAFAQKVALLPYKPFSQLAASLDLLLFDLNDTPEQMNPSTVRTVGQALDFLATISSPKSLERLGDAMDCPLLVVDDEEGARQFITSALQLAGLKNECAESPERAIEKLTNTKMNLLFLDVGLPGMNGFELCTKVRTLKNYKNTPIVFLTGMATFQNKAKATLSGGNDFVGKPFNLPELGVKALLWLCRGRLGMV